MRVSWKNSSSLLQACECKVHFLWCRIREYCGRCCLGCTVLLLLLVDTCTSVRLNLSTWHILLDNLLYNWRVKNDENEWIALWLQWNPHLIVKQKWNMKEMNAIFPDSNLCNNLSFVSYTGKLASCLKHCEAYDQEWVNENGCWKCWELFFLFGDE